jgi:membrane-associated phospholipid phosphatase
MATQTSRPSQARSAADGHASRIEIAGHRVDTPVLAWAVMAVVGLGGFAALTIALLSHVVFPFDQTLLDDARSFSAYATLWRIFSETANIPLIVIGVGMIGWLFFTHRRREAVIIAILLIAVTAGSEGVKQLVSRPRPSGTDPNIPGVVYSFPSGHVLEALSIFGIAVIRVARSAVSRGLVALAVVALVIEVFLVGFARVALAAHFPTDVLAGWFGGAGLLGCYGLLTHRDPDRHAKDTT